MDLAAALLQQRRDPPRDASLSYFEKAKSALAIVPSVNVITS
jgi:hypothetical protein